MIFTQQTVYLPSRVAYFIVPNGIGSKLLQAAKKLGVSSGTIYLGEGTISNALLDMLCLNETHKEIVTMGMSESLSETIVPALVDKFKLEKKHKGIAYIIPLATQIQQTKGDMSMYQLITTIVDKGNAEDVITAAVKAGSKGGTIMNGRGSSIYDTHKLFNMEIEPEKETVLILAKVDKVEDIVTSIRQQLQIEETATTGIIFVQPVVKTYGVYE